MNIRSTFRPNDLCADCPHAVTLKQRDPRTIKCVALRYKIAEPISHCTHYAGSRTPVDVVIVTATEIETEAVIREIRSVIGTGWETVPTIIGGPWTVCTYQAQSYPGVKLRLALRQTPVVGLSAAASLTSLAIQLFRPSFVAMLGITAGLKGETKIGDVVIPREIWDYGAGKWEDRKRGRVVFLPEGERIPLSDEIRERCRSLAQQSNSMREILDEWNKRNGKKKKRPPRIMVGPAASGAAVVNTQSIWNRALIQNRKIIALEMEGYGVARAVTTNSFVSLYTPQLLIAKSVCDFGVRKKSKGQPYAAYTSAAFFKRYLDTYIIAQDYVNQPTRQHLLGA